MVVILIMTGLGVIQFSCAGPARPGSGKDAAKPALVPSAQPGLTSAVQPPQAKPSTAAPAAAAPAAAAPAAAESTDPNDPDCILVTVNGVPLRTWQAQAIVDFHKQGDIPGAAVMWANVQKRVAEAKRRGLLQKREYAFMAEMNKEYYIADELLNRDFLEQEVPRVTEKEALFYYNEHTTQYMERFTDANIQHIAVQATVLGQEIAQKAKQGEDFNQLVRQYSKASDKDQNGLIEKTDYGNVGRILGRKVADEINKAKPGDIIGPILGDRRKGFFEVIKVISLVPPQPKPFENIKGQVINQLNYERQTEAIGKLQADIEARTVIQKTPEFIEWEKKVQQENQQN